MIKGELAMEQKIYGSKNKPLKVQVISDTHYYSVKCGTTGLAYEKAEAKSQMMIKDSAPVLDAAFDMLAEDTSTDIVLLSGDITHNGEIESHREVIEKLRGLKQRGKRVYVITATHDYQDDGVTDGYGGDAAVPIPAAKREELWDMYYEFGPDEAIATHRPSMSYIVQLCDGYRLFALNDDSNCEGGSGFSKECTAWILEQLKDAQANDQYVIAMTHHPMLSPSPFYAIIGKNDMQRNAAETVKLFADSGIHCMLTGHTHVHDISDAVTEKGNRFYDVATAAVIGYPPTMRDIIFDPAAGEIRVSTRRVEEVPGFDMGGRTFSQYAKDFFIGMISEVLQSAATDIDHLAEMTGAFSVPGEKVKQFGWLIKPVAKFLTKLTIGRVGKWTRAETGLKKEDYAAVSDKKVVDFILEMVTNLYGGDAPYTPDTNEYKITIGLLNIIDSVLNTVGFKIGKVLKGAESVRSLVEPLLYNAGICDDHAVLKIEPLYTAEHPAPAKEAQPQRWPETVRPSKKGPAIVIIGALAALVLVLLLIATLPVTLPVGLLVWLVKK